MGKYSVWGLAVSAESKDGIIFFFPALPDWKNSNSYWFEQAIHGVKWQIICTSYCPTTITAIPVHQQTKQNKTTKQKTNQQKILKINQKTSHF